MIGGAVVGSAIRDLRIANVLAERGYDVHVFWAIDETPTLKLHPRIKNHLFFNAARYNGVVVNLTGWQYSRIDELIGRTVTFCAPLNLRMWMYQRGLGNLDIVKWAVAGLINHICRGVENDPGMLKRFAGIINREKITHLIPNLSVFGPFCDRVKKYVNHEVKYLLTFQGFEVYAQYAREIGRSDEMHRVVTESARSSDFPAVAVSEDYKQRIQHELGLLSDELTVLPACIELSSVMPREHAEQVVARRLPDYRTDLPLVTYMGRQDPEKGIDLLLYAAKMLQEKGQPFQLAVCGTTAWGCAYRDACRRISFHLRVPVLEADYLSDEERTALYRASYCIVYPSIHREPFGMVPVEAMAQSTPVIVPDKGGIAELPFSGDRRAGLRFRSWDTADLATQLEQILNDKSLHETLSQNARQIAEHYSAERVTNGLLELLEIELEPPNHPFAESDEGSQSPQQQPAKTQDTVVA